MDQPGDRAAAAQRASSPIQDVRSQDRKPNGGVALCLSGGGYRAMLFHVGALWRLNEVGWLPRLDRISSVSGGSVTAGVLALAWERLEFDEAGVSHAFRDAVAAPLDRVARSTIDVSAIALGMLLPGSIGERLAGSYRRHLFGDATLQDLPDTPRFVFNSTSLQSGVLRRFSKPYAWDYRVGKIANPRIPVAVAVAASSAFPPFLSPIVYRVHEQPHEARTGDDLQQPPYTEQLVLTDGGVYDNLGLETAWHEHRTVLISDGGGQMKPEPRPRRIWPLQVLRVLSVIDNQVRSLRKRHAIAAFEADIRDGAYWGIRTDIADYRLPTALPAPFERTIQLAEIGTRLKRMPDLERNRLVNWGYAVCDAAMRRHVDPQLPAPTDLPYPDAAI
jgi:NTE family protein